jgi:hypothetical protein
MPRLPVGDHHGQERRQQRQGGETARVKDSAPAKFSLSIALPAKRISAAKVDALIRQLREPGAA